MTALPPPDPLYLAELIVARLCHDLSGPIGPLAGMLELALEDPDAAEEALAVMQETAAGLIARIRLLRSAWTGDCGAMDSAAIGVLVTNALARKQVTIDLSGLAAQPIPPATARLLLNVLMLGTESLPGGGTLACAGAPDGDIVISIAGPRAGWPPGLAACLIDPAAAWRLLEHPRDLQLPLVALLASRPGPRLSLLFGAATAGGPPPLLISHRGLDPWTTRSPIS